MRKKIDDFVIKYPKLTIVLYALINIFNIQAFKQILANWPKTFIGVALILTSLTLTMIWFVYSMNKINNQLEKKND